MKKIIFMMALLFFSSQVLRAQCNCRSNIFISTAYRDNLNNTIPGGVPTFTPATLAVAQAAGNKIALYVFAAPCNPSVASPCYGRLKAILTKGDGTVVSTPFYSTGGWSASYTEILVPVSFFTTGVNSFQVFGECNNGSPIPTQCNTTNSPQVLVSGATSTSCVAATITPHCDFWTYVTPGNPHAFGGYTGEIAFEINATTPPGCTAPVNIRLTRPDGSTETRGYIPLSYLPQTHPFNTAMNGTYTVDFLDAFGNVIQSYSYNKAASLCPVALPCNSDLIIVSNYLNSDNTQTYPGPPTVPAFYSTALTQSGTFIILQDTEIGPGSSVKLDADPVNGYILISPGFTVYPGADFVAQALDGCGPLIPN